MITRLAPLGAAIVIVLGGRVCTGVTEDPTARSASAEAPASAAGEHAPSEFVEVAADTLLAFSSEDPRSQAAADLRDAVAALEQSDFHTALQRAEAAVSAGVFAPDLAQYQRAAALTRLDRPSEAVLALAAIERSSYLWPEAVLEGARLMLAADDGAGAAALLGTEGIADDGKGYFNPAQLQAAEMLRSRALRARGQEGDYALAYRACKRVWLTSGRDSEASNEAQACMEGLESQAPSDARLSLAEKVQRAQVLGAAHANTEVIGLLEPELGALRGDLREGGQIGCSGVYELGRAHHKLRKYGQSIPILESIPASCPDPELLVKSLYVKAQGEGRAGRGEDSIASFVELSRRYPEHSYADDGLYQAGRQAQKDGDSAQARRLFTAMAETFPNGDMVGKGLWGMAWAHIQDSEPQQALPWLERLATGDAGGRQRDYVLMARYWRARALLEGNGGDRSRALELLSAQAVEEPLHYYGLLSLWKLRSLDPVAASAANSKLQAKTRALRAAAPEPSVFRPERTLVENANVERAIALLQGGFPARAGELLLAALGDDPGGDWKPETLLFASHLLELAGDPYASHNLLRKAFRTEHPAPLPEHRPALSHAYPLAFHSEIAVATRDFPWDPMLFQGLVREESAFMSAVVSWAGAMGLSQLMWPTAKETARKMGIKGLKRGDLDQPALNLAIGSTYFQGLHKRWKGHLPLAIASYNAGPGAVNRWLKSHGELELDLWVESIPFDQTRHYVKRVLSSFQVYHFMYDDGAPYVPLRIGPVRAAIDRPDPVL